MHYFVRKVIIYLILSSGLTLLFSSHAVATSQAIAKIQTIPNKSQTDTNSYHTITLDNNLRVLLVSDPQAERSSASLSVNVGSFQDPDEQQGLIHLLEHMLFLGTKKYPNPSNYQTFINKHGGTHNAYTSTDVTNFYFDINPISYEGGLDRFSQFFISPLLNESLIEREKNTVDSEYKSKFKSERRRNSQALKILTHPDHPYNHFTVGNLETLQEHSNIPLREQLLALYKTHYFAENMALVLVANLDSNQLASLAQKYFSNIPSGKTKAKKTYPKLIQENKPQLQFVRSLIDSNIASFHYQIDRQSSHYKTKPTRYLSYILGNQSKNSLYASLKSQGLINALSTNVSSDYGDNAFFTIKAHLTNKGMEKIDTIAKQLFTTINLLKSSPINALYLEEGLKLSQLMYNNQSYVSPQQLARSLSATMLKTPTKDILSSFRINEIANKKEIKKLLQQLTIDNLLVQVVSNKSFPTAWGKKENLWQVEPWYQSEYSNHDFSQSFLDMVNTAPINSQISLPEENKFIPESLDLISEDDDKPFIAFQKEGFTYWNKSDTSFKKPVSMNFIAVRFKNAANTAKNTLLNRLWSNLFYDSMSESTYAPYIAGLGFSFYPHINGVTLRTNGYSDKQSDYITWLIDELFSFQPNVKRFELVKRKLMRDLINQKSKQAYHNANSALSTLITENTFSQKQLETTLTSLSLDHLLTFIKEAKQSFDMVGYSTGNITKEQTKELANSLYQRFNEQLSPKTPMQAKTKPLTAQQKLRYQFESNSNDNVVLYTLISTSTQSNQTTKEKAIAEKAYISILKKLIQSSFYQELRTQKQLGYIVGAQNLSLRDTPALGLLVQSPNQDTQIIINAIQDFLKGQKNKLETLSAQEFNTAKLTLLNELKTKAKDLSDNAFNEWSQIGQGEKYQTKEEWIATVESLKLTVFKAFLRAKLDTKESTEIVIHNKAFPTELQEDWLEASLLAPFPIKDDAQTSIKK